MRNVLSLEFLSGLLAFAGNSLSLFLISPRKHTFRTTLLIWTGVFFLSTLLSIFIYIWFPSGAPMFSQAVSLGVCGLVFLATSQGNFLKNLFLYTSYINVFLFSIAVSQALASSFVDNDLWAVMEFRMILLAVFCIILVYDIRPAFRQAAENIPRGWGALTVLVCIFCGCLLVMAFLSNLFLDVTTQTLIVLVVLFVIMVSSYIVIFKTIGALSEENRKRQLELEKKFMASQLKSYEQMEREGRKYRHDFRHHNRLILEYAKRQDCDAIIRYLQEYETIAESRRRQKFCENLVVNSIISVFYRQAEEQGIRMTMDIRMRKETFIRDTDLVSILANLLENAVKGSLLSSGEHWIHLMIHHKGKKLIIQCQNSCEDHIRFQDNLPQAVGRTGIGVTSIVDTAAAYAGNTEFLTKDGIFVARILLNDCEERAK